MAKLTQADLEYACSNDVQAACAQSGALRLGDLVTRMAEEIIERNRTTTDPMPCLNGARARWDAEARQVRYYANFEGTDDWIEIPGEDFSRLVQLYSQESTDAICNMITGTLDKVKDTLADFTDFREGLEKRSQMTKPTAPEGEN